MSSVELPAEIWRRILEINPRENTALHAVNRMFFDIIMARRYKSVSWGYVTREAQSRAHALKSPLVSRYIKELCIHITPSRFFTFPPKTTGQRRLSLKTKNPDPPSPTVKPNEVQEFLEGFMAPVDLSNHLPSLQLLAISAGDELWEIRHYHLFLSTFRTPFLNATRSIASTLRVLVLATPLEFLRDGIFGCDISFPLLQDLALRLFTAYLTTDHENVFEASIVPFINRHSRTLTTLSFATPHDKCPQRVYRFEALLSGLSHIQGLSSFSFHWFILPCLEAGLNELGQFIHLHSASLATLSLHLFHPHPSEYWHCSPNKRDMGLGFKEISQFYTPSSLFLHPLFTHSLPSCGKLKKFDCILMGKDTFQTDDAAHFLKWFPSLKCAETLTTLHLSHNWFDQLDLVGLVSSVDLSSLRDLSIRCRTLSVSLFDVFSARLMGLQVLRVKISGITTRAGSKGRSIPGAQLAPDSPFVLELQGTCYPGWTSLTEIHLPLEDEEGLMHRSFISCWAWWEEEIWISHTQFPETFPNLQTFSARIN